MQHSVVCRLRGLVLQKQIDRVVKSQPLGNTNRQQSFPLQLLVDQEILPVRIVLNRSHAVRSRVFERQQDGPAAQLRAGRRNVLLDQIPRRRLADDPG